MVILGGKEYNTNGWMNHYLYSTSKNDKYPSPFSLRSKEKVNTIDVLDNVVKNYKVSDEDPKLIKFSNKMQKKLKDIENNIYYDPFKTTNNIFFPNMSYKQLNFFPYQIDDNIDEMGKNINIYLYNINTKINIDDNTLPHLKIDKVRKEDVELLEEQLTDYIDSLEKKHNHYLQEFINILGKKN